MKTTAALLLTSLFVSGCCCCTSPAKKTAMQPPALTPTPTIATYSIVAFDPATGDLGVAVQSKFFGVGSVVPWARAGVGAIATQAEANVTYGPEGLRLLAAGRSVRQVVEVLTEIISQACISNIERSNPKVSIWVNACRVA